MHLADNISSNLLISSMLKEGSVLLNKQFKLTRSFNIVATSYQSKRLSCWSIMPCVMKGVHDVDAFPHTQWTNMHTYLMRSVKAVCVHVIVHKD